MLRTVGTRTLRSLARRSLPRAISMIESRQLAFGDVVYAAIDATRSPGRELVIDVLAEEEQIDQSAARQSLRARLDGTRRLGLPCVFTAVIPVDRLLQSLAASPRAARRVADTFFEAQSASFCAIVAIAGDQVAVERLPIDAITNLAGAGSALG